MTKTQIAKQATKDQQNGVSIMRGREGFVAIADRAHYQNMWLESMRVNGASAAFTR